MHGRTVALLSLMLLLVPAAKAWAWSLQEIIALARTHEARSRAERYEATAGYAEGWRDVAVYGPTVRASGHYQRSRDVAKPEDVAELDKRVAHFYESGLMVGLEQPLIDLEKAGIAGRGLIEMDLAHLRTKKADEDLLLRVFERYYTLLSNRQHQLLAEAETAALKTQLENTREKLALGFGTITDHHYAEARYRLSLAAGIAGKTEVANALRALEELVGRALEAEVFDLDQKEKEQSPLSPPIERWLAMARENNTDLRIRTRQYDSARLNRRIAQSRFLPALVLFADYQQRWPDGGLLDHVEDRSEVDIGLRLKMNLLSGGADTAGLVAASQRSRAAREQVRAAEQALTRSIRSLWDSITGTRELIETYRQATEANRLAMESTQASYNEGAKVLLDVLNAQQDYFRSFKAYKTAHYDYLLLLEKFKLVVGKP